MEFFCWSERREDEIKRDEDRKARELRVIFSTITTHWHPNYKTLSGIYYVQRSSYAFLSSKDIQLDLPRSPKAHFTGKIPLAHQAPTEHVTLDL